VETVGTCAEGLNVGASELCFAELRSYGFIDVVFGVAFRTGLQTLRSPS
jgi:hypothetical protein